FVAARSHPHRRGGSGGAGRRSLHRGRRPGGRLSARPTAGIAVGVSGAGSNLRALAAAANRGELGGEIRLVFADRQCPALEWAGEQGIDTALLPDADDATLADTLAAAGISLVVLAGYMRIVGPAVLGTFGGRILNTHPSLLPAFPGAHAVRDALAAGVRVTGATVQADDEASLHERIKAVEHRLLPRVTALLLAGAISVDGRRVTVDAARADATAS